MSVVKFSSKVFGSVLIFSLKKTETKKMTGQSAWVC